jgi:hypothetical protein
MDQQKTNILGEENEFITFIKIFAWNIILSCFMRIRKLCDGNLRIIDHTKGYSVEYNLTIEDYHRINS